MKLFSCMAVVLGLCQPAFADPKSDADSALQAATRTYATLKNTSINCELPIGDYVTMKTAIIDALLRHPGIDVIMIDRQVEREYELEVSLSGTACTPTQRQLHSLMLKKMSDDIDYLRETISKL